MSHPVNGIVSPGVESPTHLPQVFAQSLAARAQVPEIAVHAFWPNLLASETTSGQVQRLLLCTQIELDVRRVSAPSTHVRVLGSVVAGGCVASPWGVGAESLPPPPLLLHVSL